MARITIEDCVKRITNRFELVMAAVQRTKQLMNGAKPLIENVNNKHIVIALREIAAGKVIIEKEK